MGHTQKGVMKMIALMCIGPSWDPPPWRSQDCYKIVTRGFKKVPRRSQEGHRKVPGVTSLGHTQKGVMKMIVLMCLGPSWDPPPWKSQDCHKMVTGRSQECPKNVTRRSQGGPRGDLFGTHTKGCHEDDCVDVLGTFLGPPPLEVPRLSQDGHRKVPRMSQECHKKVPGGSQGGPLWDTHKRVS